MKRPRAIWGLLGLGFMALSPTLAGSPATEAKPRIVSAKELEQRTTVIVGNLGLPIVTAVEIEATVIEDVSIYDRTPTGVFLLRVEKISGTEVKEPITLSFVVRKWSNAGVAENRDALDARLKELRVRTLDPNWASNIDPEGTLYSLNISTAQEAEAYKGRYVGSRHRLVVYEKASIDGAPLNLPKDISTWSTGLEGNYSKMFSLVVLGERKL